MHGIEDEVGSFVFQLFIRSVGETRSQELPSFLRSSPSTLRNIEIWYNTTFLSESLLKVFGSCCF